MGIFDRFRRTDSSVDTTTLYGPAYVDLADTVSFERIAHAIGAKSPGELWREQPHLRTVVTFLARNIAQLGLQSFQRVSDTDRVRLHDGVAEVLARPNGWTTSYELIHGLVADLALYDRALWMVTPDADDKIIRIPIPWLLEVRGGDAFRPAEYVISVKGSYADFRVIPAENILDFHGWHPATTGKGSSPVEALKDVLAEQVAAADYRRSVWERGGKVSAVISRPAGSPDWSDTARDRFREDWRSKYAGRGPGVGGTPILEDGMTINKVDFSAHEQEYVEGTRLALNTVASVYHINPTMIGLLDNANYSNVREFRKMLYGDTLGPVIAQLEDRINTFLVPILDSRPGVYTEFNIEEKLQGNFEEQSTALSSSVGRPWMTANEARALRNMPSLDGGDELVTPLNVLVGGQASPRDSGSQNVRSAPKAVSPAETKTRPPETYVTKTEEVLGRFFARQRSVVLTALGSKADAPWWDGERWDRELADDLQKVAHLVADKVGADTAERLGFDPDTYDVGRTQKFLRAVAESRAASINATTQAQIADILGDPESDRTPADVFSDAEGSRKSTAATTLVTTFAGFAVTEAARQVGGNAAVKTWSVNSSNPRPSHASMDGETVGIDELFSNGLNWPGDPAQGPDETAGCTCSVDVSFS